MANPNFAHDPQPKTTQGFFPSGNSKNTFVLLRIIQIALMSGVTLFSAIVFSRVGDQLIWTPDFKNPLPLLALAFTGINLAVATQFHRIYFKMTAPWASLRPESTYMTFAILRWALIEGAALFSAVCVLITYNVLAIVALAIAMSLLIFTRASEEELHRLIK